jgi:hypothetical protein
MPASPAQILTGSKAAFSHRETMLGWVKCFRLHTAVHSGVTCKIYEGDSDANFATKLAAIPLALARVTAQGFTFPNGLKVYCTYLPSALSIAFHRDFLGQREAAIILGPTCVVSNNAGMYAGVAHSVMPLTALNYCEAVVVHELGHNLHERASETFFWDGAAAGAAEPTANQVTSYATKNALEFVAEVFTGRMYGRNYGANIMAAYQGYGGPNTVTFP